MQFSSNDPPRLRFLVAGPLSPRPTGRRSRLLLAELADRMAGAPLAIKVDVGPALGAAGPLHASVNLARFRDFSAAEVIGQALGELHRFKERLIAPSGRPRPDDVLATIERITGRGPLHAEVAQCFAPPPPKPADAGGGDLVDELLSRGPQRSTASSAIDALVRTSVRSTPAGAEAEPAKAAHARISAALARAAAVILADPAAAAAERRWRALRLFLGQCPKDHAIEVEALDVGPDRLAPALAELAELDPLARPDAVFVIDPVTSLETAGALAEVGADLNAPIVIEVGAGLFGGENWGQVARAIDDGKGPGEAWEALRKREESRWLTAVANPPTLAAEATAAGERVVCGGAALAVAGLLAGSFRDLGVFSRLGADAEMRAPATWHSDQGQEDIALATAEWLSLDQQQVLGGQGIAALGGPRGGDIVALVACPVAIAGEEGAVLPAQMLAGRTVRFALWARDFVPAGVSAEEGADLVMRAAALLLLPGGRLPVRFGAKIERTEDGAELKVGAAFSAALAGAPVALSFGLPLRVGIE